MVVCPTCYKPLVKPWCGLTSLFSPLSTCMPHLLVHSKISLLVLLLLLLLAETMILIAHLLPLLVLLMLLGLRTPQLMPDSKAARLHCRAGSRRCCCRHCCCRHCCHCCRPCRSGGCSQILQLPGCCCTLLSCSPLQRLFLHCNCCLCCC
jgi:hypothetical protein